MSDAIKQNTNLDRRPEPDGSFPINYYRVPRDKYTFDSAKTRKWVETRLSGRVLNAFAGECFLNHDREIVRNDANPKRPADYHVDAAELDEHLEHNSFDTIVHDPPWSKRQAEKSYEGFQSGEVGKTMKAYNSLLKTGGCVISLGYTVTVMPAKYSYERQEMAIFECIGRGDDYFGCIVKKMNNRLDAF